MWKIICLNNRIVGIQMIHQQSKDLLPLIITLNKIISQNRSQEDPLAILVELEIILLIKI